MSPIKDTEPEVLLTFRNAIETLSQSINKLEKLSESNPKDYELAYNNAKNLKENLSKNLQNYVSGSIDSLAFTVVCHMHLLNAELNSSNTYSKEWRKFLGSVRQAYYRAPNDIGWPKVTDEKLNKSLSTILQKRNISDLRENLIGLYSENSKALAYFYTLYPDDVLKHASFRTSVDLVKAFPDDIKLVSACYQLDPKSIEFASSYSIIEFMRKASPTVIANLINKNPSFSIYSVKAFPEDKNSILASHKIVPDSIRFASPTTIVDLVRTKAISAHAAAAAFPENKEVITACYQIEPTSIRNVPIHIIVKLIETQAITPAEASEVFPDNFDVINACYQMNPDSIMHAKPAIIAQLVDKGYIPGWETPKRFPQVSVELVKAFPENKKLVSACYQLDPKSIEFAATSIILELISDNNVEVEEAVATFPENELIISACYRKVPDYFTIREASPTVIANLITKNPSLSIDAVKAFPEDKNSILISHKIVPDSIRFASPTTIADLVTTKAISAQEAATAFPQNVEVITACYQVEPTSIRNVPISIIVKLIETQALTPAAASKAFPNNLDVIHACYQINPDSIKHEKPASIAQLVDNGLIPGSEAVKRFPDNEEIIISAENQQITLQTNTESDVITLIESDKIPLDLAIKNHPKNTGIIEAAYKKDPASIVNAHIDAINKLGQAQTIKMEDILTVFKKTLPSDSEKSLIETQFIEAMTSKNWQEVARICDKFWFEKPSEANRETISQGLSQEKQWKDLYQFEKACHKQESQQLIYGPLRKTPETYQLEELARKMLQYADFTIENSDGDDYFKFPDGTQFDWTKIRANANWQHVALQPTDFRAYYKFMRSGNVYLADCTLGKAYNSVKEKSILDSIYKHHEMPSSPMSFAEMQALNIYSGSFYLVMNSLMSDATNLFDYRTREHQTTRAGIIHAVMCASGINKAPMTDIQVSTRGARLVSDAHQQKLVEEAARKGIVRLEGFVSSSGGDTAAFGGSIYWKFDHLRGINISPFAQIPEENEFLIPPTDVNITDYDLSTGTIQGSLVSVVTDEGGIIHKQQADSSLQFAKPETVISLINKGTIDPERAVKAFPNNKNLVLACYKKDAKSLEHASIEIINEIQSALPKQNLDTKLMAIQDEYQKTSILDENNIRELFQFVCKTQELTMFSGPFSTETEDAHYVINAIQSNKELCEAFGIDYHEPKDTKIVAIQYLMEQAYNNEPLFALKRGLQQ